MIPSIDFNLFVLDQLPAKHRMPYWVAWMRGAISQSVRKYNIFYQYMNGSNAQYFNGATVYAYNEEVMYKYKVYKSRVDANTGNTPDSNPTQWEMILESFIGAKERARFVCKKIVLEYALNRYFQYELAINSFVGFVQPDDPVTPTNSSIYITNFVAPFPTLLVGFTEAESGIVGFNNSYGYITYDEIINSASSFVFIVHIPAAVYTDIHVDAAIAEKIVRNFLDRYVMAGITYTIETY